MRSRQVAIGAVVAAALVLGANAGSLDRAPLQTTLGMQGSVSGLRERVAVAAVRVCGGEEAPHASVLSALQACGDGAVGEALDVFGELTARLKQL